MFDVGVYRKYKMSWGLRRKLENLLPQTFGYPADGMMRSALPWAFPLDDDGTVLTKYGALQRTIRIRGIDDQSSNRQVQADFDARINNVLKRVGTGTNAGVALWIDADRHVAPPLEATPRDAWGTTASWVIDAERVDAFNGRGAHLETECHVTYCRMLPSDKAVRWQRILIENAEKTTIGNYREFVKQFREETDGFALALRECGMPEAEPLTTDETLTYLHSCVSARRHPVQAPDWSAPIDDMLADSDLVPGLVAMLGGQYVRAVSVLTFPGYSYPSLLNDLDELGIEYRATWRWVPYDDSETDSFLDAVADRWKRARKGLRAILWEAWTKKPAEDIDGTALERGGEVEAAASAVRNGYVSLGHLTLTVTVMHPVLTTADAMAQQVMTKINGKGLTAIVESYNTVEAWLGSVPGNPFANIRRRVVTSMNLSHLMRTTAKWAGPVRNESLKFLTAPLITCSTGTNDLFRFLPYVQDVGHTNIFGPNGSGKSALIALWSNQFMRYPDANVRIFEQGRSARIPTLAAGGVYYSLDTDSLSFQPLRHIDSLPERVWARDWLCDRIEQAGVAVDPGIRNRVWDALESLAAVSPDLRTMTGLLQLYRTDQRDDPVKAALQDFTTGAYAHFLNGDTDPLELNSRWVTFEMGELLKAPRAAGAVLSYIFHRMEQMFDGRPTVIFLDEGWQFLLVGEFARKIKEWLKTLRKKNVSVVFASQEIADSVNSEQASTLISECLTKVYLANGEAKSPEIRPYYQRLGLRNDQIDRIGDMVPKRDYFVVSRLGSRVFDLNLDETPVGLRIVGASSDADHKLADKVLAKYGRHRFLEGWMVENGFYNVADELREIDQLPVAAE